MKFKHLKKILEVCKISHSLKLRLAFSTAEPGPEGKILRGKKPAGYSNKIARERDQRTKYSVNVKGDLCFTTENWNKNRNIYEDLSFARRCSRKKKDRRLFSGTDYWFAFYIVCGKFFQKE